MLRRLWKKIEWMARLLQNEWRDVRFLPGAERGETCTLISRQSSVDEEKQLKQQLQSQEVIRPMMMRKMGASTSTTAMERDARCDFPRECRCRAES